MVRILRSIQFTLTSTGGEGMGGGGCGGMVTREACETDDVKLGEFGHKVVSPRHSHFWRHQIYLYSSQSQRPMGFVHHFF